LIVKKDYASLFAVFPARHALNRPLFSGGQLQITGFCFGEQEYYFRSEKSPKEIITIRHYIRLPVRLNLTRLFVQSSEQTGILRLSGAR